MIIPNIWKNSKCWQPPTRLNRVRHLTNLTLIFLCLQAFAAAAAFSGSPYEVVATPTWDHTHFRHWACKKCLGKQLSIVVYWQCIVIFVVMKTSCFWSNTATSSALEPKLKHRKLLGISLFSPLLCSLLSALVWACSCEAARYNCGVSEWSKYLGFLPAIGIDVCCCLRPM